MSVEHPVEQPIRSVEIDDESSYTVGSGSVTRIEATTKSGMYADLAYVRVWAGDVALAEFCQHNVKGVYFDPPEVAP